MATITRRNKFNAVKITIDGITFDSKREAARYDSLRQLEQDGKIQDLRRQVKFSLDVNGYHICDYKADFTYQSAGGLKVEDAKGYRTPVYRLKRKLLLACHGIEVVEV